MDVKTFMRLFKDVRISLEYLVNEHRDSNSSYRLIINNSGDADIIKGYTNDNGVFSPESGCNYDASEQMYSFMSMLDMLGQEIEIDDNKIHIRRSDSWEKDMEVH